MLVDCQDCGRSYHLNAADLGPHGRVVICPRCDARWFQRGEGAARIDALPWAVTTLSAGGRAAEPPNTASPADHRALAAGRRAPPEHLLGRARVAVAVLMVAGAGVTGIGARRAVVRVAPRTASFYAAVGLPVNLRGLEFARLTPSRAVADVSLAGEIRNVAHGRVRLPRLVYEVRDRSGAALMRWSEGPPAATLAAGRAVAFASPPRRLPVEGSTVLVRFEDPALAAEREPDGPQQVAAR